jgi:hypothetical protein
LTDTSALYEPFIERDLAAIPAAARAFAAEHSSDELWVAVARFAVLAYAPSQHAKRAVMACRAAHVVRDELGERWPEMIVECGRYAAESRQPWSEPPIFAQPAVDDSAPRDRAELRAAIDANDRFRAERWLSARIEDAYDDLRALANGDALLMLDTAVALEPLLGRKGRYALLRMVVLELFVESDEVSDPLETLIDHAIAEKGSIDSVRNVFIAAARNAGVRPAEQAASPPPSPYPLAPYPLARDYAQTLIAHAIARTLPTRADEFLAAVHHNLEHGESFAAWSFA